MTPIDVRYSAIAPDFKIFNRLEQLMYTKVMENTQNDQRAANKKY